MASSSLLPAWTALPFPRSELPPIRPGPRPVNENRQKKSEKRCATPKKGMTLPSTVIPSLLEGAAAFPSGRMAPLPAQSQSAAFRRGRISSWPRLRWNWSLLRRLCENATEHGRLIPQYKVEVLMTRRIRPLFLLLLLPLSAFAQAQTSSPDTEARVDSLLKKLTLEE